MGDGITLTVTIEKQDNQNSKLKLFWLSFCDASKPEGQHFLGVVMTRALNMDAALLWTHSIKVNPGGEVVIYECPNELLIDVSHLNKLLSKQFLQEQGYV